MSITLSSEQKTIVANLISTGSFQTVDEVLQAALRSLEEELNKKKTHVVNKTLTLLWARGERQKAIALGHALFGGDLAVLHYVTPEDVRQTWQVFQRFADKDWSFTDCVIKVVMKQLGITQAFCLWSSLPTVWGDYSAS